MYCILVYQVWHSFAVFTTNQFVFVKANPKCVTCITRAQLNNKVSLLCTLFCANLKLRLNVSYTLQTHS